MGPLISTPSAADSASPDRQSRTDELMSALHAASTPSPEARAHLIDEIVLINTPVAHRIARRFRDRGCVLEDLEQTACLALTRAVQQFDPGAGHHFLSYVVPCISGEVKRHFRDQGWMIRPPRPVQELQSAVERERRRVEAVSGRPPEDDEIARRLAVPVDQVRAALVARGCFAPTSLESRVSGTDGVPLRDTLAGTQPADEYEAAETRTMLAPALARLRPDQRRLIQLHFVEERSQRDIGRELGISQSQVSRLLREAVGHLREILGDRDQAAG